MWYKDNSMPLSSLTNVTDQRPSPPQSFVEQGFESHRQQQINGSYIGYIRYWSTTLDQNDYIMLYNDTDTVTDGHSAEYGQVSFMGRNEPAWIYKSGGPRKFRVSLVLVAGTMYQGYFSPGADNRPTKTMNRDSLTTVDVDRLARTMLSWTYSDYRKQFSAPKRVWLNYGAMFQRLPCLVDRVERSVEKPSPWEKLANGADTDLLPHVQKVSIDLTVCSETLNMVPGAYDIAIASSPVSASSNSPASANGAYGVYNSASTGAVQPPDIPALMKQDQEMLEKIKAAADDMAQLKFDLGETQ